MSAVEPLCLLMGINPGTLTKEENILLEAELFGRICDELREFMREQHKEYFLLIKVTIEKENTMLETKLARLILQDILSTNQYNLEGIARYTGTHEDVIQEVCSGLNLNPSAIFFRKIIELHRTVRHELYLQLIQKVISKYLATNR